MFGFGTGILAYTLGMRHAFDADHIAAIDNTTRKLIQDGKRPFSVGFLFSLGHSTIVFVLAVCLNFGIRALDGPVKNNGSGLHHWTGIIGTSVSGIFLWLIALLNLIVLVVDRQGRSGRCARAATTRPSSSGSSNNRGLMNRFLGGYAKRIDTAVEDVPGRRAVRARLRHGHRGRPAGPGRDRRGRRAALLRRCCPCPSCSPPGMCLFDTIDGCFMNFAYDWAFAKPIRKVFYNLTITGLSVFVALFIGTIEILGLIGHGTRPHWRRSGTSCQLQHQPAGFVIVGAFVVTWVVALASGTSATSRRSGMPRSIPNEPAEAAASG